MAHEITATDGAAFVGRPAWHGLGRVLATPPATVREALEAAGLTWTVEAVPVQCEGRDVADVVANVRSDTRDVLGVVSGSYRRVQNETALSILDGARELGATIETLGSVRGGRIVFATVRLPADFAVAGVDPVEAYAAVTLNHDGGGALRAFATPVRIVCMNTIRAARAGADGAARGTAAAGVAIPHRGDVATRIAEGSAVLQAMIEAHKTIAAQADRLVKAPITPEGFRAFLERLDPRPVAPDPDRYGADAAAFDAAREKYEAARDRWATRRARVGAIMNGATGTIGGPIAGTWWSAYSAATEALQYGADGGRTEARAVSTFLGAGADRTAEALSVALELAGA
jgi:phage/plasmid-like protein (TIGR03299 family)